MFADIGFFFMFLIEIVLVLLGIVTIAYGFFSLSVKKFDPAVRVSCFIFGFVCLSSFAFLEFKRQINEDAAAQISTKPEFVE